MPRLLAPLTYRYRALTFYTCSGLRGHGLGRACISASAARAPLSTTCSALAKDPSSTPGWGGRGSDSHAVDRSPHDPQAEGAQQAIKDREEGNDAGQAINRKDEGHANRKAKEDHPAAPEPVIGMNDERGQVKVPPYLA